MSTKQYLSAILIFITFFSLQFFAKAQDNRDTIRIVKNVIGMSYYQNDKMLDFNQLMDLSKKNEAAYKLMKEAYTLRVVGIGFSSIGGFSVGFSAGYAIGKAISGNIVNMKVFLPFLGAGAALIAIGIGFEVGANNKAKEGVAVFNNAIKQKNNANLNLGFSPNGMMFRLTF